MTNRSPLKSSPWLSVLVIFIPSWALQFWLARVAHNPHAYPNLIIAVIMWCPALVAMAFLLWEGGSLREIGWRLPSWRYGLAAFFVPFIAMLAVAVIDIQFGWATEHVALQPRDLLLQGVPEFAQLMALAMVTALGEEIGWRGYLQKRFLNRYGLAGGLFLLGLVWGYWHTPIFYLLKVYREFPALGAFVLNPYDLVVGAFFTGWLYLRTRSIWAPTITHAVYDVMDNVCFGGWIGHDDMIKRWFVSAAIQGVIALVCFWSLRTKPSPDQIELTSTAPARVTI